MNSIPFDKVKDSRGIWMRISDIKVIIDDKSKAYITPKDNDYSETIRNEWLGIGLSTARIGAHHRHARHVFSIFSNLIVYENIFVDALAAELSNISNSDINHAFGPLHENIILVDIKDEVYNSAAKNVGDFLDTIESCGDYIAPELIYDNPVNRYSTEDFENILQYLFKNGKAENIPLSMIDTCSNSLQRLFLYFEIQTKSKVPLRQTKATIDFISSYEEMLGGIRRSLQIQPQEAVENVVQEIINGNFRSSYKFDGPPLFKMILDEIKGSRNAISVAQAAFRIRNKHESKLYRDWLWKYFNLVRERDALGAERHFGKMQEHLDAMVAVGRADTIWTGREISLGFSKVVSASPILRIRLPRSVEDDYVQFIGQWL